MTQKQPILILVPRLDGSSPMKGAVALAHGLAANFQVILVALKGCSAKMDINANVQVISLESEPSWRNKLTFLRRLLADLSQQGPVTSISICFSADVMNRMLKKQARIISSVRSNLWKNYYHTYGLPGYALALAHHFLLRSFDHVVAISADMFARLKKWRLNLHLIGNFIDEPHYEKYRSPRTPSVSKVPQLLFLGGLNSRKRPELLIESLYELKKEGREFHLSLAGEGPMADSLKLMIERLDMGHCVALLGHVKEPYALLQQCDLLVLPSESEGVSRAVLEAMYFGVPCILRDVDGNRELIQSAANGFLFSDDKNLVPVLRLAFDGLLQNDARDNLIPQNFSFKNNIEKFKILLTDRSHAHEQPTCLSRHT